MGFRKSIKIAPGVKVNVSKSGVGYSVGTKGARVTKRAGGGYTRTVGVPGTGLSSTKGLAGNKAKTKPNAKAAESRQVPVQTPGPLASLGERQLYNAMKKQRFDIVEGVVSKHPKFASLAAALAGLHRFVNGEFERAGELLEVSFSSGEDPGSHEFTQKYLETSATVGLAPGVSVTLPLSRDLVGLSLAEIYQARGDIALAISVVEGLDPTMHAAVSLAELYLENAQFEDVVELTNGLTNTDDASAFVLVQRGAALREIGLLEASRNALKEALKSRSRAPEIRHLGYLERARTYLHEGKVAPAKKDLERIVAEDMQFPGARELLATLQAESESANEPPPLPPGLA